MSLDWIPQLFYDIVARLVPGAMAVAFFDHVAEMHFQWFDALTRMAPFSGHRNADILIFLALAYLVGITLAECWTFVVRTLLGKTRRSIRRKWMSEVIARERKLRTAIGAAIPEIEAADLPRIHMMQAQLRRVASYETLRLLRVRSDYRFCHVLAVASIICLLADFCMMASHGFSGHRLILAALFAGLFLLMGYRAWRLERFWAEDTCVAWLQYLPDGKMISTSR